MCQPPSAPIFRVCVDISLYCHLKALLSSTVKGALLAGFDAVTGCSEYFFFSPFKELKNPKPTHINAYHNVNLRPGLINTVR